MVDDPYRVRFEVDHADRLRIAVGAPAIAVVNGQRQFAVGRDGDIVGKDTSRQIALVVSDLVAVYGQQGDLVGGGFGYERVLAVGGDRYSRDTVGGGPDRHGIDDQDILPAD